ncbi:serine acetyltransferase [Scandinavium sp.]|uniref:serine acetyltransferase n=1 Tax=Scandinavium sp. TaxID=2830653 RepID=UPI00289B7CCD|nr:serine acetyltransferase [Scandinavium sp.]
MYSYSELKKYWHIEVIGESKKFSYLRIFSRLRNKPGLKFVFWWRLADYLFRKGHKRIAYKIHSKIKQKFTCDLMLGATIGPGLTIAHHVGVVVTKRVVAGKNMKLTQNCVIGSSGNGLDGIIKIGDNFYLGSNSCVIGDNLTIGDNVIIGAMSFINKDIPDNCTVYTKKVNEIVSRSKI